MAPTQRQSLIFLCASLLFVFIIAATVFSGLLPVHFKRELDSSAFGPPVPVYRLASFDDIRGWSSDEHEQVLPVFLRSCDKLMAQDENTSANSLENLGRDYEGFSLAGKIVDWQPACEAAARLDRADYANDAAWRTAVRVFFEAHFNPVVVMHKRMPLPDGPAKSRPPLIDDRGTFTGYFEPVYPARRTPTGQFTAPLLSRPDDLIDVNLGRFSADLAGERIAGRIEGNRLVPYDDRAKIENGDLNRLAKPLGFLDPNDLFFLQIQGSGQIRFEDGTTQRVGYDGANGHGYTAIGRLLVERGEMTVEDASMQSIRQWLASASENDARRLREANASYVFFRPLDTPPAGLGPPGAQGVALTPHRSIAVDRRFHAMGTPVYVDIPPPDDDTPAIRKLMIAQDTGGAIRGPVRGDYFWGAGEEAGQRAGVMNADGRLFVLMPTSRANALSSWLDAQ